MMDEIYNIEDYRNGFNKIESKKEIINKLINHHSKEKRKWTFRELYVYQINLTLYGPGGSYNNETGTILIYTTKEGLFKRYEDPSNTIIHEVIHIG